MDGTCLGERSHFQYNIASSSLSRGVGTVTDADTADAVVTRMRHLLGKVCSVSVIDYIVSAATNTSTYHANGPSLALDYSFSWHGRWAASCIR